MSDQQSLFQNKTDHRLTGPLPDRIRPHRLEQYVGQESLIGPGAPLRRAIEEDRVLYEPKDVGLEKQIREKLELTRSRRGRG